MSMEIYEDTMRQLTMYQDIKISEQQIKSGQVKDARTALAGMREKYGISDGGLNPATDTDKLLTAYRGGSHPSSDI